MSDTPKILAFAGSARRDSLNRKLLAVAVAECRAAGAEVTVADLNEFEMPLYHGDWEERNGLPEAANRLIALIAGQHGLLIASPEYNSQITPLLKNTLDWCSRSDDDPFPGKVAAVISASPGPYGGIRSAQMARQLLNRLGCFVIPAQCSVSTAHEAFDEKGGLKSAKTLTLLRAAVAQLADTSRRLGIRS